MLISSIEKNRFLAVHYYFFTDAHQYLAIAAFTVVHATQIKLSV